MSKICQNSLNLKKYKFTHRYLISYSGEYWKNKLPEIPAEKTKRGSAVIARFSKPLRTYLYLLWHFGFFIVLWMIFTRQLDFFEKKTMEIMLFDLRRPCMLDSDVHVRSNHSVLGQFDSLPTRRLLAWAPQHRSNDIEYLITFETSSSQNSQSARVSTRGERTY
jgi:hypothetical protein